MILGMLVCKMERPFAREEMDTPVHDLTPQSQYSCGPCKQD